MKKNRLFLSLIVFLLLAGGTKAMAAVYVQCPANIIDPATGQTDNPNIVCRHITSGDGYIRMADGADMYIFGFSDVTGIPEGQVMNAGMLTANFSAPTMSVKEGQEFYLTLTNVGMMIRPDLFDPHTVHFHGFPNASSVFDGEPMASMAINMGASLTYYYNIAEPGTYLYHCHVEATEHMQMGMIGNLFVRPAQDGTTVGACTSQKYVYNDADGSTCYDVAYPIQSTGFDPAFHWSNENVQPLPFASMTDTYTMINGRGYPDTINPAPIANMNGHYAQNTPSLITANAGQKILLRISNVGTVDFYTFTVLGVPMKVLGKGATILRGGGLPSGQDLYYTTNSITLGGGETTEVLLDTTGVAPGTYFLYTTNMNHLSNDAEDFGGLMTEIVVN